MIKSEGGVRIHMGCGEPLKSRSWINRDQAGATERTHRSAASGIQCAAATGGDKRKS